jgi:manganese oxidase
MPAQRNPGATPPHIQIAVVLLCASAAVHLWLIATHGGVMSHAVGFSLAAAALVLCSASLWRRHTPRVAALSVSVAGGLVVVYAVTRVSALPLVGGPEALDAIGVFTKVVELAAIALLAPLAARCALVRGLVQHGRHATPLRRAGLAGVLGAGVFAVVGVPVSNAVTGSVCPNGARTLTYDVVAMNVDIVFNDLGDHNPNGAMYALASDETEIRRQIAANPNKTSKLVRPLVIRANRGDCVVVNLRNKLDRRAGFHVQGVAYDVRSDDGSKVGDNPDSTVAPGATRAYTYYVPSDEEEGAHMIEDLGDPRGGGQLLDDPTAHQDGANGSVERGLYGALNVEPAGSTWTDPETGASLAGKAAPDADIHIAGDGNDFREGTLIGWDETDVLTKNGEEPKDHNGGESSFFGFNYRYEPLRNRRKNNVPEMTSQGGDGGDGEELAYSSWAHGDPSTPVIRGYKGDPTKLRILMAGTKETHVFHLHAHRWRNEPKDPKSTRIDSISWGPGQSFSLDLEGGIGSTANSVGDSIFHCHLYPHFIAGFWGLLRSHDVLEDGTRHYPDGTKTPKLVALPDRQAPPAPTATKPGYPHFVPGAVADSVASEYPDGRTGKGFGHRPPQAPLGPVDSAGVNDRRGPFDTSWRATGSADPIAALTPTEKTSFPDAKPGAPYADPCTTGAPVRKYEVSLIQRRIDYNNNGWHDPEGRMFVLKRDEAAVLAGTKEPEPLIIRANEGDCVDFSFTNKAPLTMGGNKFQSVLVTNEAGMHVHLVKFDVLGSDGATNGWNYDQSALRNQTMRYRWMVDTDLKSIFWHDHAFAGVHQQHGVFAGMVAEPKGSTHRHPKTGEAVGPADLTAAQQRSGWRADILDPSGPDFREFAIFAQDFVPLFDKDSQEINPPELPDDLEDQGVSGINYRNAPFKYRRSRTLANGKTKAVDPSLVYSSKVHGDPETPIMEAYRQDPVRIRLFQGSQEEQHTFSLHGARWRHEPDDPNSELRSTQSFGLSEAFNFQVPTFENCGSAACKGDYLYSLNDKDSLWLGAWGIFRAHKFKQDGKNGRGSLLELPDAPSKPPEDTNNIDNTSTSVCGDGIKVLGVTLLGSTTCVLDADGTTTPPDPGSCPSGAPVRKYSVVAFNVPLTYNSKGDKEDFGLIYSLAADESAIKAGKKKPEPLMIRVNKGDCAEVTLTNKLPKTIPPREGDDPKFENDDLQGWGPSNRVSIHAGGLLKYEVNGSDGATVGYNSNQTIAPGESITQRWYADEEVGAVLLEDKADQLNHRFRGLFGGLVVEPAGSTWTDQKGVSISSGTQAIITTGTGQKFREFGMFLQDGLNTVNAAGQHPMAPEEEPEDAGDKGLNYRSAPFSRRLTNPGNPSADELTNVFSSQAGPIDTPLLEAIAGDPVRIRLYGSQDQRRQHSFEVTGHAWPQEPGDPNTVWRNNQDAIGPGVQDNLHMKAGGAAGRVGDYRYGSSIQRNHREAGLWGLLRVLSSTTTKINRIR